MVFFDRPNSAASGSSHTPDSTTKSGPITTSSPIYDVAIIGAGIIGLATALELSDAGLSVVVFDRQLAMHEASWAAGGMLAADDPGNAEAIHELSVYSRSIYPEFLLRIQQLTGRFIQLRTERTLEGLPTSGSAHRVPKQAKPLTHAEIERMAPGLTSSAAARELRFVSLNEQSLDPCDLTDALPVAARAAKIDLREYSPVSRVVRAGALSQVFYTRASRAEAADGLAATESPALSGLEESTLSRHVLLATGSWLAPIAHPPAVAPCKGNMLTLELEGPIQTNCVLRVPGLYIIPRGQSAPGPVQYVVGSTLERIGFDQTPNEDLLADLERRAIAVWPPLSKAKRVAAWAGLRPESPDGLPILGAIATPDPNHKNLWVATAHFRNGILQAPGTARLMRHLITGAAPAISLERFCCDRLVQSSH